MNDSDKLWDCLCCCGEDQPTLKRAKEVNERIEAAAEKLGIEVRAGVWEE